MKYPVTLLYHRATVLPMVGGLRGGNSNNRRGFNPCDPLARSLLPAWDRPSSGFSGHCLSFNSGGGGRRNGLTICIEFLGGKRLQAIPNIGLRSQWLIRARSKRYAGMVPAGLGAEALRVQRGI